MVSYGQVTRESLISKDHLLRTLYRFKSTSSPFLRAAVRVLCKGPLPGPEVGDTFTNGNFLCKCQFPSQKEFYAVFRTFPAPAVPQLPSTQNNHVKLAYSGDLHCPRI